MKFLKSKCGRYLYAKHNSTIRADLNGNVYGGGLFGGKKERPEIRVPSAEELLGASAGFVRGQFPEFAGARETGLAVLREQGFAPQIDIPGVAAGQFGPTAISPAQIAPVDFAQFGPTSFEQALGAQQFQNIFPDVQRQLRHALSLSGMATSPILAQLEARERGRLGVDIGSVLAQLGQRRGELELGRRGEQAGLTQQAGIANLQAVLQQQQLEQSRLQQQALSTESARQFQLSQAIGQDPFPSILGGAQLGGQQAQRQAAEQLARFAAEPQGGGGGALLGMLGGAVLAPFTGGLSLLPAMAMGGALGGGIEAAFGGGTSPVSFQDALSIAQASGGLFGGGGGLESLFGGAGAAAQAVPVGAAGAAGGGLSALLSATR